MKPENLMCLENIVRRKAVQYGFQPPVKNSPRLISMAAPHEVFSLLLLLGDEVVVPPLPLKMSVSAVDDSFGVLIFPSPPIILKPEAAEAALWLTNEANRELYRGIGCLDPKLPLQYPKRIHAKGHLCVRWVQLEGN